jgi:3'(2'), 5'-bisphosphate nucleotidase
MNDQELVKLAVRQAAAAAAEILAVQAAGFTVQSKTDHSPVTLADMRAERVIVDGLRAATPHIPVIAEEEVAAGKITAPGAEFWLVDPLDGTREFAANRPDFAVNIGLIRNNRAVLGAVAAPANHEIYYGVVGHGAWKQTTQNGNTATTPIAARKAPLEGLTIMASRHYQHDPALAKFLANYKISSVTNIGSALKFCKLAEGQADLYPRLGRTMEWDTAAPQAVLQAAGGHVMTLDNQPLRYGKPGFENPHFICHGIISE